MPGGKPRKPDELKILDGTFRKDKDGDPAQSVIAEGEPAMPPHLKGDAAAFWGEIVPQLLKMGVAKASDSAALAMMCEWWGRYRRFSRLLDRMPSTNPKQYRTLGMVGLAWMNFEKAAAKFGLTPSDRAKLRVADRPKGSGVQRRERKA